MNDTTVKPVFVKVGRKFRADHDSICVGCDPCQILSDWSIVQRWSDGARTLTLHEGCTP